MNIKMLKNALFIGCFGLSGALMAQDAEESTGGFTYTPSPAPAVASTPAPAAPAKKTMAATEESADFKADFGEMRGNAITAGPGFYNAAGPFTVGDNLYWPAEMGGKKTAYLEPNNSFGAAAFPLAGMTGIFALDNSGGNGVTTFGIADNGNAWGLTLSLGLAKEYTTVENGNNSNEATVITAGDVVGLNASFALGSMSAYANTQWLTTPTETSTANDENSNYVLDLNLGVYTSWFNTGLAISRINIANETTVGNTTTLTIDNATSTMVRAFFDLGSEVLASDRAQLLLGSNNGIDLTLFDDAEGVRSGLMEIGLDVAPNMLAQYAFTANWLVFGGAYHTVELTFETGENDPAAGSATSTTVTTILTQNTVANTGIRYQNKHLAAEASLANNVYANGTSTLFNGANVMANFGVFVKF